MKCLNRKIYENDGFGLNIAYELFVEIYPNFDFYNYNG